MSSEVKLDWTVPYQLDRVASDPAAYRGDWKPLQGSNFWRLRVGDWRSICEVSDAELVLLVLKIAPKRRRIQMNTQIIELDGKPAFAVVPFSEWAALHSRLEILQDIADAKTAGDTENFPTKFADRLLSGDSPLKVWREYRGMTLQTLGQRCAVTRQMLSMIEHGKAKPSVNLLTKLADALGCGMEDIHVANDQSIGDSPHSAKSRRSRSHR